MLRVDAVCSRKLMRCHIQSVYGAMNLEGCSEGLGVAGSETAAETAAASASLSRRCRSASRYSDSSLPFNRNPDSGQCRERGRTRFKSSFVPRYTSSLVPKHVPDTGWVRDGNMQPPSLFPRIARSFRIRSSQIQARKHAQAGTRFHACKACILPTEPYCLNYKIFTKSEFPSPNPAIPQYGVSRRSHL